MMKGDGVVCGWNEDEFYLFSFDVRLKSKFCEVFATDKFFLLSTNMQHIIEYGIVTKRERETSSGTYEMEVKILIFNTIFERGCVM